jgi:hypothetical protein
MLDYRILHCDCACHYFPKVIRHDEPCCDAVKLFKKDIVIKHEKVNIEKKNNME